jgi:hypothetical protein
MLRVFFKFDRRLLGDLCRCALRSLTCYFEAVAGSVLTPGVIAAIQTFGDRINLHVHLHFLATEGGVDEAAASPVLMNRKRFMSAGVFYKIPRIDDVRLAEIFAREVSGSIFAFFVVIDIAERPEVYYPCSQIGRFIGRSRNSWRHGKRKFCKMALGGLVKIRVDMLSNRPDASTNYQLQGTDGCYESALACGEKNRIWLRSRCKDAGTWLNLDELRDEFLPDFWKENLASGDAAGHGGGDYFEILDFVGAIEGKRPNPIGIHEAMEMTLLGLVSQLSIREGSRWMEVPDSRMW